MKVLNQTEIKEAAKILKDGGLIAFPTETVFGLGVVYDNKVAYDRLNTVKRRPPEKPYTMMLADPEDAEKYCELNDVSKKLLNAFIPGQFTLICRAKSSLPKWCISSSNAVGIRVPDMKVIRDMIREVGKPLLVPSANKSGEAPANTDEEALSIFKNEIDAIIKGESDSKTPSTILLVDGEDYKIIREGNITLEQIKEVLDK